MKYMVLSIIAAALIGTGCSAEINPEYTPAEKETPTAADKSAFALGADISWCTQLESEGCSFYSQDGKATECTALMKSLGMNSIRLRVWVNPEGNWSSMSDVLAKALRARDLGMRIMIDFHYSDTWADPGKQVVPAAWSGFSDSQLADAVSAHTGEVLSLLKNNNVDVEWVQIGNETTNGMLYSSGIDSEGHGIDLENGGGSVWKHPETYAALTAAGCSADKKIYPEAKVIVHVDQGHNISRGKAVFESLKNNNVEYDIIGLSLYPNGVEERISQCIENISTLHSTYGHDIMICEVGMAYDDPDSAYEMLTGLISGAKASGHCLGVFYWEPEAPAGYNGGYTMGAFDKNKPTRALDAFTEASKTE